MTSLPKILCFFKYRIILFEKWLHNNYFKPFGTIKWQIPSNLIGVLPDYRAWSQWNWLKFNTNHMKYNKILISIVLCIIQKKMKWKSQLLIILTKNWFPGCVSYILHILSNIVINFSFHKIMSKEIRYIIENTWLRL